MKIKTAIILHGLSSNGVDTMFANLSACWDREKFDIYYFLAVDPGAEQFCEERVLRNGCRVIHLHDLNGTRKLKWARTLYNALEEYGPFDVIHSNLSLLSGLNLQIARRAGIPVRIAHVHTLPGTAVSPIKRLYQRCMRPLIDANATERLACSGEAGKAAFGNSPFRVVENGIGLEKFLAAGTVRTDAGTRLGQIRFVTVGRISPDKNPGFLLDIFNHIYRMLPGSTLTWVGEGPLRTQIEGRAAELGLRDAVSFPGILEDVSGILAQCGYFLFPSLHEGFGNALIEAQAAGLDCFASDAVPRITDCGGVRFLPLALTAEAWAGEITKHIQSGQHMKTDLQKVNRFDIRKMAEELMQIYQEH